MEYLLFVAYLVTFAWLVTKVKFFTRSGITQSQLIILFLVKVMAGIFYGWIGIYYSSLAQMLAKSNPVEARKLLAPLSASPRTSVSRAAVAALGAIPASPAAEKSN